MNQRESEVVLGTSHPFSRLMVREVQDFPAQKQAGCLCLSRYVANDAFHFLAVPFSAEYGIKFFDGYLPAGELVFVEP